MSDSGSNIAASRRRAPLRDGAFKDANLCRVTPPPVEYTSPIELLTFRVCTDLRSQNSSFRFTNGVY